MLRLRDIEYQYPGLSGFRLGPIDLEISTGSLCFWSGHNGCGKSTLARVLSGELKQSSGFISERGSCIHHHQAIDENVFADLRVRDCIRLLNKHKEAQYTEIEAAFPELKDLSTKYADELSGGQLQLLAVSIALLGQHDLYIFDEVLNHLAPELATRVMDYIQRQLAETEKAHCIVISHDAAMIQKYATELIVFREGRIVQHLCRDEIMSDGMVRAALLGWRKEG